jgi:predicted RNA-binding Zn-ribbon protein involved in translation (DUF1610 family)
MLGLGPPLVPILGDFKAGLLMLAVGAGGIGVMVGIISLAERRPTRDERMRCHSCGEFLRRRRIAVASQNCPSCGVRILRDPEPVPATREMFPLVEFKKENERYQRRFMYGLALPVLMTCIAGTVITGRSQSALPGGILMISVAALCGHLLYRWTKKWVALRCPSCNAFLGQEAFIVIASQHCPNCGRRVISEGAETAVSSA